MYHIALCDDDPVFLARLQALVEEEAQAALFLCTISAFTDVSEFLSSCGGGFHAYDAIFLDIEMPGQNGIELAEYIRERNQNVLLLFITTHEEFVFRSFEVEAFRYIPKARLHEHLPGAVLAIQEKLEQRALVRPLALKTTKGEHVRLHIADLLYVRKDGKNCIYYTQQGEYSVRQPLCAVQEMVAHQPFVMINSGYLVNIEHVPKVDGGDVVLTGGQRLPISRLRLQEVKMAIHLYWSNGL